MKKLLVILPLVFIVGCAGHISIQTQTQKDTDLEIVIKSKKQEN